MVSHFAALGACVAIGIASRGTRHTRPMHDANAQPSTRWPIHSTDRPQPRVVKPPANTWTVAPPADAIAAVRRHRPLALAEGRRRRGRLEGRERVRGGGSRRGRDRDARRIRRRAASRRVDGAASCGGRESGARQQRRVPDGALRGAGARLVRATRRIPTARRRRCTGSIRRSSNASRPPGEWQTYDIVFHRPRFDAAGKVTSPARMTVLHNGVLVQDNVVLSGPTAHQRRPPYEKQRIACRCRCRITARRSVIATF